jgi:zinc protease
MMSRLFFVVSLFAVASSAAAQGDTVNRTVPPPVPAQPPLHVPAIEMRTLRNGIRVAVLENHALPIVSMSVIVDAPAVLDPAGKEGVSSLTAQMLGEGTTSMSADQLAESFADLGNGVSPSGFFTITRNVDRSVRLMADQFLHPAFPQGSLDRIKANTIAALAREKDSPDYIAGRVFANAVYGRGHPWSRTATEKSVRAVTRADLVAFHAAYYQPRNVTIVVSGDLTPDGAVAALEPVLGGLAKDAGKNGDVAVLPPSPLGPTKIYLYDRPSSPQSVVVVGGLGPKRDTPDFYALELANTVLGGAFNSRLNLNLREVHGFTYGASSEFEFRRVPQVGTFEAGGDISTPKTDSAVALLMGDVRAIRGVRPVTDSELAFAKASEVRSLPRAFATVEEVAGAAAHLLEYRLPLDYYDSLTARYERVTTGDTQRALVRHLDPSRLAIVIVGDRKVIERGLRAAKIAPVVVVDEQARPLPGNF